MCIRDRLEKQQKKLAAKGVEVDLATLKQDWLKKRESGDFLEDEEIDVVGSDSEDEEDHDHARLGGLVTDIKDAPAPRVESSVLLGGSTNSGSTSSSSSSSTLVKPAEKRSSFSIDSLLSSAEDRWISKS